MIRLLVILFILSASCLAFAEKVELDELVNQSQVIEQSIKVTRQKIKDNRDLSLLPDLYMTLADFQNQKATVAFAVKHARSPKTPVTELDTTAEKRMKEDAIETYNLVISRFTTYRDADRAYYYMAIAYSEIGQIENSLRSYKQLTDLFPQSTLWEAAQFAIGSHYFEKKDFDFAITQFDKIVQRPESPYTALASFRMGWCYINQSKWKESLEHFAAIYKSNSQIAVAKLPEQSETTDIKEEALVASVWPLLELKVESLTDESEVSDPLTYYETYSPSDSVFLKVLTRLARRFEVKKRYRESARALYLALQLTAPPRQKLALLEEFYVLNRDRRLEIWPDDYAAQVAGAFANADSAILKKYEPLVRDVATQMQALSRSTGRPEDFEQVVQAYETYLRLYEKSTKASDMKVNFAEALFNAKHFVTAAHQYEIASGDKNHNQKSLINSALQSYIEALKDPEKLSRLERMQGQVGFATLCTKFIAKYPNDATVPSMKFNLAKLYFDKHDFKKARVSLRAFVDKYQTREEAEQAVLMLLDTFYQEGDLKHLSLEGDRLLTKAELPASLKDKVQDMVHTAKLRRVRALAGDFGSKKYSENLLKLAQNSKEKGFGESAIYEAFLSAKARKDAKTYSIGETYLARFPESPKAVTVDLDLIQMALHAADFPLAARYMEGYRDRHPQDPEAGSYLTQSETLYDQLRSVPDLERLAPKTDHWEKPARALFLQRKWRELAAVANQVRGTTGLYYQGIAYYRLGDFSRATQLLDRVANSTPTTPEETTFVAHARFLAALKEYEKVTSLWQPQVLKADLIKSAAAEAQEVEHLLQSTLDAKEARWVVGSLYLLGKTQTELAHFLENGKPPAGLSKEQLSHALAGQIQKLQARGKGFFEQCKQIAEQKQILTVFTVGCENSSRTLVSEADEFPEPSKELKQESGLLAAHQAVAIASNDDGNWYQLATKLFSAHAYHETELVLQRFLENKDDQAKAWSYLGVVRLHLGDPDGAEEAFKKAHQRDNQNELASFALAKLNRRFGLSTGPASGATRMPASVGVWSHPWLEKSDGDKRADK